MFSKTIFFCLFTFAFCLVLQAQNLTVKDIMREPSIAGMRPESEKLSPDGKFVVYSWNADGIEPRNLYIVNSNGSDARILVNAEANYEQRILPPENKLNYGLQVRDDFTKAREKNLGGVEFSPDSKRILFLQNTDIYVLDLESKDAEPRRITRTQGVEAGARWLTNDSILYASGGNYFVLNLKETSLIQVTKEANPTAFLTIFNVNPTKDGKIIAYVLSDGSKQKALFVPNYLDEFVQANSTRRGFTEQKIYVTLADGSREKPFEVNLPKADGAGYIRGIRWAADNSSLVVDRIDKDLKRRQIFYVHDVGSKAEQTILVTEETDEKWIASLSRIVEPNPKDDAQILFASEKDGFNHLYLATLERATKQPNPTGEIRQENPSDAGFTTKIEIKQLTKGYFEVDWAKWDFHGSFIVYSSTSENTASRQFFAVDANQAEKTNWSFAPWLLPNAKLYQGMKSNPQLERDTLLFRYSEWNKPEDLFIASNLHGRGLKTDDETPSTQITRSTPESFLKTKWNEPKFVDIPSRDGKIIKSKIYTPANFDQIEKISDGDFCSRRGLSAKYDQRLEQLLPRIYVQRDADAKGLRRFGH